MTGCWKHGPNPWPPTHDCRRCDEEYLEDVEEEADNLESKVQFLVDLICMNSSYRGFTFPNGEFWDVTRR